MPRSAEYEVRFERPFENIPRVAIANSMLDLEMNTPIGYSAEVIGVSNRGIWNNLDKDLELEF